MGWIMALTTFVAVIVSVAVYYTLVQKFSPSKAEFVLFGEAEPERKKVDLTGVFECFTGFVQRVLPMAKTDTDDLRDRLWKAGIKMAPGAFNALSVGFTVLLIVVGALVAFSIPQLNAIQSACVEALIVVLALLAPRFYVKHRTKKRKERIEIELPGALEMLSESLTAGLTLDRGFRFVADENDGPLAEEFRLVDTEVRLMGKSQLEALRNLAARCDTMGVRVFVAAVIQASKGGSVATVLKDQAEQARIRYFQKVEEQANKVSVKMIFPLVLLLLPCLFLLIFPPVLLQAAGELGGAGVL